MLTKIDLAPRRDRDSSLAVLALHQLHRGLSYLRFALLTACLTVACGCDTFRIPSPANTAARINAVPTTARSTECEVFIVTDRDAKPSRQPHVLFQNQTSYLIKGALATVQIDKESKDSAELWKRSLQNDGISPRLEDVDPIGTLWSVVPNRHSTTNPADSVDARTFCNAIDARLDALNAEDIVVFVHGYNTKIEDNTAILAALWHYSGRKFVPVAFEWPSDVQLIAYTIDKQNAARSTRTLRLLLEMLAAGTKAKRINILAHSAGTELAVTSLQQLRLRAYDLTPDRVQAKYRLGSVILAAPDIDTIQYLNAVVDGILDLPERLTIYMSSDDMALKVSRWLFGNNRLGFISSAHVYSGESKWLATHVNGYAIDIAPALKKYPTDWLGHSYYYRNPIVSQDVLRALLTDDSPKQRGLTTSPNSPGIWSLPESIEQQADNEHGRPGVDH